MKIYWFIRVQLWTSIGKYQVHFILSEKKLIKGKRHLYFPFLNWHDFLPFDHHIFQMVRSTTDGTQNPQFSSSASGLTRWLNSEEDYGVVIPEASRMLQNAKASRALSWWKMRYLGQVGHAKTMPLTWTSEKKKVRAVSVFFSRRTCESNARTMTPWAWWMPWESWWRREKKLKTWVLGLLLKSMARFFNNDWIYWLLLLQQHLTVVSFMVHWWIH